MMEETVSKPARILEAAIKASIIGIILVAIITIFQLTSDEILKGDAFFYPYLLTFMCTGAAAMGFYRAGYGHDAIAILAAGGLVGGLTGLLSGISNSFLIQDLRPLDVSTGETLSVFALCICPVLFVGAFISGVSAWGLSFVPSLLFGFEDIPEPHEEEQDADSGEPGESESKRETTPENEPDALKALIAEDGEADTSNPTAKLRQAIRLIGTDQIVEAKKMLVELTREQKPPDPLVWLWLASTFDDEPETKRQCIQKVLEIHPTSPVALEMLNNLEKPIQPPIPPPPVKRVPITYKPEMPTEADEPQEFSLLTQVANRFWWKLRARIVIVVIFAIVFLVGDGCNNGF